jgi:hypothetical protein
LAHKIQTPGNHPKDSQHGESLKSRMFKMSF